MYIYIYIFTTRIHVVLEQTPEIKMTIKKEARKTELRH